MKRIIAVWTSCIVLCLLVAGVVLLYKSDHTEGSPLWMIMQSADAHDTRAKAPVAERICHLPQSRGSVAG